MTTESFLLVDSSLLLSKLRGKKDVIRSVLQLQVDSLQHKHTGPVDTVRPSVLLFSLPIYIRESYHRSTSDIYTQAPTCSRCGL